MGFAKSFARFYEKKKYLEHQMLGRQVICPINPATQRVCILKIVGFLDLILDQCAPPYIHTRGFLSRSKKTGQVDIAIKQSWLNATPSSIMRLLQKL